MKRLPIDEAADRVANFMHAMTLEIQMLARACGKADVHDLEPEDLRALTLEAAAITGIPLVGTDRQYDGAPQTGPPYPPTLGRTPAKPGRASTNPPTLGRTPAKPGRASTSPPTLGRTPAKPGRASRPRSRRRS